MLKQETIDLLKGLGIEPQALIDAVKSETETDVKIPVGKIYSDTDLASRDANIKAEGKKEGVAEGKIAGFEIFNKELIAKYGLNPEAKGLEPKKVIELLDEKIQKGDTGLQEQINKLLQDKQGLENKLELKEKEYKQISTDNQLMSYIPKNATSLLDKDEHFNRVKKELDFEEQDGRMIVKNKTGEILRNPTTQAPISPKEAIEALYEKNKDKGWVESKEHSKGREGGNYTPPSGGVKTKSQAIEEFKQKYPDESVIGAKASSYILEYAKKDPDFDMHS